LKHLSSKKQIGFSIFALVSQFKLNR